MRDSGNFHIFSVELKMILSSACRFWLVVQRDGGIWSLQRWTRNHLLLHRHPDMSLENTLMVETLSIHQVNLGDFLPEQVDCVSRLIFPAPDLFHKIVLFHLRLGNLQFSPFRLYHPFCIDSLNMDFRCIHLFQLLKVHIQYVSLPDSRVQFITQGKFHGRTFLPNWWILDWSFVDIGWYSTKWNNLGLLYGSPTSPYEFCFPIRQSVLNISQVTNNIPWNPPNFRPIPIATTSQMSLLNSTCCLGNPICCWKVTGWDAMIPR